MANKNVEEYLENLASLINLRIQSGGVLFIISLTPEEAEKFAQLAEYRGRSQEQCFRDFLSVSSPGGSGWEHPGKKK